MYVQYTVYTTYIILAINTFRKFDNTTFYKCQFSSSEFVTRNKKLANEQINSAKGRVRN